VGTFEGKTFALWQPNIAQMSDESVMYGATGQTDMALFICPSALAPFGGVELDCYGYSILYVIFSSSPSEHQGKAGWSKPSSACYLPGAKN
jgi:hypothetical protein